MRRRRRGGEEKRGETSCEGVAGVKFYGTSPVLGSGWVGWQKKSKEAGVSDGAVWCVGRGWDDKGGGGTVERVRRYKREI